MRWWVIGGLLLIATITGCSGSNTTASFCGVVERIHKLQTSSMGFSTESADPGDAERALDEFQRDLTQGLAESLRLVRELEAAAPAEIRADVALIAARTRKFADTLRANDYDFFALFEHPYGTPDQVAAADAALRRVNEYSKRTCGVELAGVPGEVDLTRQREAIERARREMPAVPAIPAVPRVPTVPTPAPAPPAPTAPTPAPPPG